MYRDLNWAFLSLRYGCTIRRADWPHDIHIRGAIDPFANIDNYVGVLYNENGYVGVYTPRLSDITESDWFVYLKPQSLAELTTRRLGYIRLARTSWIKPEYVNTERALCIPSTMLKVYITEGRIHSETPVELVELDEVDRYAEDWIPLLRGETLSVFNVPS
jgi:hypothetical protein